MDKIIGNFLSQANRDFPLDCETLEYLQGLAVLAGVAGNMAGDRVVLWGCDANADGTRRDSGYVFVRTRAVPEGEVLRWEGGLTAAGMYVRQEDIGVSTGGCDYPKAYTRRSLAPGFGQENFSWDSFTDIRTIKDLMTENRELRAELAGLQPSPLGVVQLWAGAVVPEGYVLCDGRELRVTDYPELAAALGGAFDSAVSATGVVYRTGAGCFRVPDLRGRFVVGLHDNDPDYQAAGAAGGKKSVALAVEHLARHSHSVKDYYHADGRKRAKDNFDTISTNGNIGSGDTDYDNDKLQYYRHNTDEAGDGAAHENRPPYYTLAYIMRAR